MKPAGSLGPRILTGRFVALEPVVEAHRDGLIQAAQSAEMFRHMPISAHGDSFHVWWADLVEAQSKNERMAFAVRRLGDGAIVGSSSYGNMVPAHARTEIGWTWYSPAAQGTAVNPEAKLLMMANAFETAGYHRVELKTDSGNARSRAAILKLGAKEEGILRGHMWMPAGYWRDTVYYSVLEDEWPAVKAGLQARLDAFSTGG